MNPFDPRSVFNRSARHCSPAASGRSDAKNCRVQVVPINIVVSVVSTCMDSYGVSFLLLLLHPVGSMGSYQHQLDGEPIRLPSEGRTWKQEDSESEEKGQLSLSPPVHCAPTRRRDAQALNINSSCVLSTESL